MIKRQADPERDVISNMNSMPVPGAGNSIARKAATAKTRHRALARRLRKNSQMASLSAEISSEIEEIASLSDKIIESFEAAKQSLDRAAHGSKEEKKLWRSLFESSGKALEISASYVAAGEEAALAFKRNARSLEEALNSIQKAAQVHSEILKTSQKLGKLNETTDDLAASIISLSDRADIAALNSALEAGKAGEHGVGFAVVAGMLQKSTAAFQKRAEDFTTLLTRIKSIQGSISSRAAEASEKIRTIDVLTAGVRNAFDEITGAIDILRFAAGEFSAKTAMVFPLADEDVSSDDISLSLDSAMDSINHTLSLIERQEGLFAEAANHADILLEATGKLASVEVVSAALDALYTVIDSFIKSIEATAEHLETTMPAIRNAIQDTETLGKGSVSNREYLTRLAQAAEEFISVLHRSQETIGKLRESLAPSHSILRNVARELQILQGEHGAFLVDLYTLQPFEKHLSRFADFIGDFSTRMDFLSVNGGTEAVRAGARGSGFAALPQEFGAISADSAGLEQSIRDYGDQLGEMALSMIKKEVSEPWQDILLSVTGIADGIQEMLENHLATGARENASLSSIISDHIRRIEKYLDKSADTMNTASSAAQSITQAAKFAENQKNAFSQTVATAEKISLLADELYPEEG